MIGFSVKSSDLAECHIVVSEQLISFKHCIGSKLLLNSLVLFDIQAYHFIFSLLSGQKQHFVSLCYFEFQIADDRVQAWLLFCWFDNRNLHSCVYLLYLNF